MRHDVIGFFNHISVRQPCWGGDGKIEPCCLNWEKKQDLQSSGSDLHVSEIKLPCLNCPGHAAREEQGSFGGFFPWNFLSNKNAEFL